MNVVGRLFHRGCGDTNLDFYLSKVNVFDPLYTVCLEATVRSLIQSDINLSKRLSPPQAILCVCSGVSYVSETILNCFLLKYLRKIPSKSLKVQNPIFVKT